MRNRLNNIILGLLLIQGVSSARDVIDKSSICQINWTKGFITCAGVSAEGQNSFAAKLSAKVLAQRNLLEVIKGVRIDSDMLINDGMTVSEIIRSRVQGNVRGGEILSNEYDHDTGSAVAMIRLKMGDGLLKALLSDPTKLSWNEKIGKLWRGFSFVSNLNASTYTHQDEKTLNKLLEDMRQNGNSNGVEYVQRVLNSLSQNSYSGILIDVSGVEKFEKAMMVKLVDQDGKEVYPANLVSHDTLFRKNTSVGFMYGFEDARGDKRIFSTPLEIKVEDIYENRRASIVLTPEQLSLIRGLDSAILQNAKIILVLGD